MEKKSEILENFKTAIGSTVKSLSNSENIEVLFGNQNVEPKDNSINLPEIEEVNNKINYNQIRAMADSKSLKLRFSDSITFKSFEPEGNISKKLYEVAEKIRYEKLGSDEFKGIKNNIEKYYQERISSLDLKSSEEKIIESFENYLRIKFFESKNNKILEKQLKTFKKDLDEKFKGKINQLSDLTHDQAQYNSLVSELISNMSLDENFDEEEKEEEKRDQKQKNPKNQEKKAEKHTKEEQEMSLEQAIPDLEGQTNDSDLNKTEVEIYCLFFVGRKGN